MASFQLFSFVLCYHLYNELYEELNMKTFKMNNGIKIPVIGTGTNTFGKPDGDFYAPVNNDTTELISAIKAGYRLIDTAIMYKNECVIGKAVRESGIPRDQFFITSKIPAEPENIETDEAVQNSIDFSLEELDMDYMDLYLIHHPWDDNADMLRVWRVLEKNVEAGKIKSIGVSNFSNEQLGYLLEHAVIKPVVNQIESHPDNWNNEQISFCLKKKVVPQAWGPLKRISDESMQTLQEIALNYNKTWAQIILNYQITRGVCVIPKSHNAERQEQNLEIFDFDLRKEDRELLGRMK